MNRENGTNRRNLRHSSQSKPLVYQKRFRASGQSITELATALLVLVPIFLIVIDLGFIALGSTINDTVCRDACRAAASGPPSSETLAASRWVSAGQSPYERAVAVIRKHSPSNFPIKVDDQPEITESVSDVPPAEVGGAIEGDISVKTTVTVAPLVFIPNGVKLQSKHLVSFTYVRIPEKKKA